MSVDRQAEFSAWFAKQVHPEHTVPGYEHAIFMRWTMARGAGLEASSALGAGDVMRTPAAFALDDQPDGPELDAFTRDFSGSVAQDERGGMTCGPGGLPDEAVTVDPHPFAEQIAASVLARRDEIIAAQSSSPEAPALAAPAPAEATPAPPVDAVPEPAPLDLLAWRDTRARAFPLGSLDPPPRPPPPPSPPKPKLRRDRGERWLPEAHPDPASLPVDRLDVFCDGSGWLNAGKAQPAGIGVVLMWGDVVLVEVGDPIGVGTNIVAELRAIRRAIHVAASMFPAVPVTIYSDSEWSIQACLPSCEWSIREGSLERLVGLIRVQFAEHGKVTFLHCKGHRGLKDAVGNPAEERIIRANNRADELANVGRKKNTP